MSSHEAMSKAERAMLATRHALPEAGRTGTKKRVEHIARLRRVVLEDMDHISDVICSETGKTRTGALLTDILPTLEFFKFLEEEATKILKPRRVKTPGIYRHCTSRIEYRPKGVVLVIAPWNNPFQLSLVPLASALAGRNSVLLKPSERTPETGDLVGDICRRAGFGDSEMQVVGGGPEVARKLVDQKPDMIFFTGGVENGRKVLSAAAQNLIPVILELGGKDPMIVFEDADLERAVNAALYGAFTHAGQHCVSTKRLYVQSSVYDGFTTQLTNAMRVLSSTGDWGTVFDERTSRMAYQQVTEALDAGARLLFPDEAKEAGLMPTLVADVSHDMRLMREETFAPVLGAMSFADEKEALRLANDSHYGLNASVWSENPKLCERVAARLQSGNIYINNVLTNVGNPYLPFGGLKNSGLGIYHGPEGLTAFCDKVSIMESSNEKSMELNWFPHDAGKTDTIKGLITWRYGEARWWQKVVEWLRLLPRLIESEKEKGGTQHERGR